MQLYLKSGEVAWGGIMMSVSVILIILASVIESSSLFFLAAASFICGIIQRKFSVKVSVLFAFGTFIIGLILAPDKLYCFTFMGFSVYVIVAEYFREKLNDSYKKGDEKLIKRNTKISFLVKFIVYHFLLALALFFVKIFTGIDISSAAPWIKSLAKVPVILVVVCIIAAEALWIIFDRAYVFFQNICASTLDVYLKR